MSIAFLTLVMYLAIYFYVYIGTKNLVELKKKQQWQNTVTMQNKFPLEAKYICSNRAIYSISIKKKLRCLGHDDLSAEKHKYLNVYWK